MKYYTLEDAVKKSYATKQTFRRLRHDNFFHGTYNLIRALFNYEMKLYYFDKRQDMTPKITENPDFKPKGGYI